MKRSKSHVHRVTLPWSEDLRQLFRLTKGWTAPATVLVRQNKRSWTFIADFTDEAGRAVRQIVRTSVPTRSGEVEIVSEELTAAFTLRKSS